MAWIRHSAFVLQGCKMCGGALFSPTGTSHMWACRACHCVHDDRDRIPSARAMNPAPAPVIKVPLYKHSKTIPQVIVPAGMPLCPVCGGPAPDLYFAVDPDTGIGQKVCCECEEVFAAQRQSHHARKCYD